MQERDIIADIRAYRDAYAAKFNYDLAAMVRDIQSREKKGGRVVIPAPAPEPEPSPDLGGPSPGTPPPAAKAG